MWAQHQVLTQINQDNPLVAPKVLYDYGTTLHCAKKQP
jgi:hypothetical protein